MPSTTIPLILPATARGWAETIGTSAKDQQLINGLYQVAENRQVGGKTVYVQKRPGSSTGDTVASSVIALKYYGAINDDLKKLYAANGHIYDGDGPTDLGTASAPPDDDNYLLADAIVGGVKVTGWVGSDKSGWYLFFDAISNNFPTFTADTHSNTTIDNIGGTGAATTGIYVGQLVTGTGIPANTRVETVSATSFTITNPATGTATITVTKEAIAKIIDSDFPADPTNMVAMDGYFFVGDKTDGTVAHSAINNPASWSSANVIAADDSGDGLRFLFKIANYIVAPGFLTIQYFYNAGNATGSVLSSAENLNISGLQLLGPPIPLFDGFYCVAKNSSDGHPLHGLYRLTGANQFTRVSDDIISGIFADLAITEVGTASLGSKQIVLCYDGTDTTILAYDPSNGEFSLFSMDTAITSSFGSVFTKQGVNTLFTWATGNTWTDSSAAYTMTLQTEPKVLNGGRGFRILGADLIADTEASGTASFSTSSDDGANWVTRNPFDMTAARKKSLRCGFYKNSVAFRVQHSANTNFRAQALVVHWEPSEI